MTRQYCGRLGKVAPGWDVPGLRQPLGRALVDRLYLPESWTSDEDRCAAAGVPEERRGYRSKTQLALEILEETLARGHLEAGWVAGDDRLRDVAVLPEGLAALGMRYGPGRSRRHHGLAAGASLDQSRSIRGSGVPASPSSWPDSGGPWGSAAMNCRRRLGGR